MPRTKSIQSTLLPLVQDFTTRMASFIEEYSAARARQAIMSALGSAIGVRRGPGRPPKGAKVNGVRAGKPGRKPRRRPPPQLCPVPNCKNRAAPVFGMVCKDHRGIPKDQIRKYREARRKQKDNAGNGKEK